MLFGIGAEQSNFLYMSNCNSLIVLGVINDMKTNYFITDTYVLKRTLHSVSFVLDFNDYYDFGQTKQKH